MDGNKKYVKDYINKTGSKKSFYSLLNSYNALKDMRENGLTLQEVRLKSYVS